MHTDTSSVALQQCGTYQRLKAAAAVDRICRVLKVEVAAGTRVLLKPNLLTARSPDHLACTQPEFVAAVAGYEFPVAVANRPSRPGTT